MTSFQGDRRIRKGNLWSKQRTRGDGVGAGGGGGGGSVGGMGEWEREQPLQSVEKKKKKSIYSKYLSLKTQLSLKTSIITLRNTYIISI